MNKITAFARESFAVACAIACIACGSGQSRQEPQATATSLWSSEASSWAQTLSSADGTVTPLHVTVDARNRTFVLACLGPCDTGVRLLSGIDPNGDLIFSKRVVSHHGTERLNLLSVSKDGRIALAGDRVADDGTTSFAVEVFRDDGRFEWRAHDDTPAQALDATFDAKGQLIVVGAAADGSGLTAAFSMWKRHVEWRFTAPNAAFSRVRSDDWGFTSVAGVIPAQPSGQLATVWRLRGRGHLVFSYTAPDVSRGVALAVDDEGHTALASTKNQPASIEGETPLDLVTTKLDSRGGLEFVRFQDFGVSGSSPLDAAFGPDDTITIFGRHQGTGRFGGDFQTTRYDKEGTLLWSNDDNFGFADANPTAMALDRDGDVAEVGNVVPMVNQTSGFVVVYGADGSVQSTRLDPSHLVDVARDLAGGILVLGALGADTIVTREADR